MSTQKLLVALIFAVACVTGLSPTAAQAETIRVYYRWDREWQQGPFPHKWVAQGAADSAYEQGSHEVRILHEPLMDSTGNLTGYQYFVRGVQRGKVESRDFTNRGEAARFYNYKRQSGFKVAHKIRK